MAVRPALALFEDREDRGIDTCTTCPSLCRWTCPVAEIEARETTAPQRLVSLSGLVKKERATIQVAGTLPYHCSQCGACTEACLHHNDVPLLLDLFRSRSLSAGQAPAAVRELCGHFGVAGNPQGRPLDPLLEKVASNAGVEVQKQAPEVYFPGCTTLELQPDTATHFLRLPNLFGLKSVAVTSVSASCCGLPLLWAGDLDGFRNHARRFAASLAGVERLIVHEPSCAQALLVRYPEFGVQVPAQVQHVGTFLAPLLDGPAPLRKKEHPPVAYVDCCQLTRGLDLVDQPRQLLMRHLGDAPRELEGLHGRQVDCCGATGLLPLAAPATAQALAEERLTAFRATGASELVTFSPRCAAHFKSVAPSVRVVDVSAVLARL